MCYCENAIVLLSTNKVLFHSYRKYIMVVVMYRVIKHKQVYCFSKLFHFLGWSISCAKMLEHVMWMFYIIILHERVIPKTLNGKGVEW